MGREGRGIWSPQSEGPLHHCLNPGLQDPGLVCESHLWGVCSLQAALQLYPHRPSLDRGGLSQGPGDARYGTDGNRVRALHRKFL